MLPIRTIIGLIPALAIAFATVACGGAFEDANVPQNGAGQLPEPPPVDEQEAEETIIGGTEEDADDYADTDPSAITDFQEPLAPYGAWVDDTNYGTVWVPHTSVVGADFVPYSTGGHWAYNDEYTWVSDYSWGWAPFHYGRWIYADTRGWAWIPGRRYSPAWVTWRVGPSGYGYVGWGPMQPDWYWHNGYAYNYYRPWPSQRFVYCPTNEIFHGNVGSRVVNSGPRHAQAQAATREYIPASPGVAPRPNARSASAAAASNRRISPDPRKDLGMSNVPSASPSANTDRARMFASPRAMAASNAPTRSTIVSTGAASTSIMRNNGRLASPRASSSFERSPSYPPSRSTPSYSQRSSSWSSPRPSSPVVARPSAPAVSAPRAASRVIVSRPSVSPSRPSAPVVSRPAAPSISRSAAPSVSRGASIPSSPSRSSSGLRRPSKK